MLMVPVVIAVPMAIEPAVWVLPMLITLAAVPPITMVLTPDPSTPTLMVLASVVAVVPPMLMVPVEPESIEIAPVVPELMVRLLAAAELSVIEPEAVSVVAPLPVRVEAAELTVKRMELLVSKTKELASLVPRVAVVPKLLPF